MRNLEEKTHAHLHVGEECLCVSLQARGYRSESGHRVKSYGTGDRRYTSPASQALLVCQ